MLSFSIPADERRSMMQRLLLTILIAQTFTLVIIVERETYALWQVITGFANGGLLWLFVDLGDCLIFQNAATRFSFTLKRYLYIVVMCAVSSFAAFWISDWITGLSLFTTRRFQVFSWAILNVILTLIFIWLITQQQQFKEDQITTKDARLRLLESQLEPHMLFNTLANLRALVISDTAMATKMLDRIVNYLRANLSGSRTAMHSLSAEFERLEDYLEIMKMRMGSRLSYSLYLAPELAHHLVPPFILQPLVENAIKHGLEPKIEGGRIFIKAVVNGGKVVLEVNDTGLGVHQDDLMKSNGFGWTQVSERLVATYGQNSTINLIATEAYKTSAIITFPYNIELGIV
jgi:LytS/YehU family sensor histidine kinase